MKRAIVGEGSGTPSRYRVEGGKACIDIKIKTIQQIFDGRDPAPFRERDLDEDAVDYIVGAAEEIPRKIGLKIVFWISDPSPQVDDLIVVEGVRSHFTYELERLRRRLRQLVRQGQLALLVGIGALVALLSLAELALMIPAVHVRQIVREGLVITGWVAIWRPLDVLLYEWWPVVRQRRLFARILASDVTIVHGQGTKGSSDAD